MGSRPSDLVFDLHVRRKRRVERVPVEWAEEIGRQVKAGQALQDVIKDMLSANAELLTDLSQSERKSIKLEGFPPRGRVTIANLPRQAPGIQKRSGL